MATAAQELPIPTLTFRAMQDSDVPAVMRIENASYAFPWTEGIFRDCLRAGYVCRVAELGGQIAGYAVLGVGAAEAHLLNVCIAPSYRCRGLGRRLLEHVFDLARAAGALDLFLEVRPSNTTAIRLYQSLGLEQVGIRRGYYQAEGGREDAVVMRRALPRH